jgi:hypothetical protein
LGLTTTDNDAIDIDIDTVEDFSLNDIVYQGVIDWLLTTASVRSVKFSDRIVAGRSVKVDGPFSSYAVPQD